MTRMTDVVLPPTFEQTAGTGSSASNPVQDVRDAIDRIDETPFGKVGKLLDRMADDAQRAINERKQFVEALDGMLLVCGRTGNAFYDFEEQAATFQADTGWMRPGKDMPAASGGNDDNQARREKYNAWVQSKIELAREAMAVAKGAA